MGDQNVTYGQLEAWTNQLARILKATGCQKGDRVCFAIPKSPTAIVAILGILKAGCIHVPVDTSSPAARVTKILAASRPRLILGVGAVSGLLDELFACQNFRDSVSVGWMENSFPSNSNFRPEFSWDDIGSFSREHLEGRNSDQDPAHILFTSGSTGDPKGVVITHSNIIHFVDWAMKYFGINSSDRVSGHPPLHFDLAYFDIFGALATGAQLCLVPAELSVLPNKLAEFMRTSRLTQWFSVPSVLNYMAKFDVLRYGDFPSMKRLLWCGEVFPTPALIYWMQRLPHVTFTNLYGPTETTIASSYYTIPSCPMDEKAPIPIGTACDGEELLVLDENLQPISPGKVGELYIRGVGLSPGYWCDAPRTAAAFLSYGPDGKDRIYRTGDLGCLEQEGMIYFVGRRDTQIKSRGYRIELGEIEAALHTLGELKECAVVAIPSEGFEGNLVCCAYVLADAVRTTHAQLRNKLSKLIPGYMLPARWLSLDRLPVNANGKLDRRTLRELFAVQGTPKLAPQAVRLNSIHTAECGELQDSGSHK
jgi:amino acid adenylation domain-containing protein